MKAHSFINVDFLYGIITLYFFIFILYIMIYYQFLLYQGESYRAIKASLKKYILLVGGRNTCTSRCFSLRRSPLDLYLLVYTICLLF